MKKKLKIFLGIDLQALTLLGFFPKINMHKNIDCHLKT